MTAKINDQRIIDLAARVAVLEQRFEDARRCVIYRSALGHLKTSAYAQKDREYARDVLARALEGGDA